MEFWNISYFFIIIYSGFDWVFDALNNNWLASKYIVLRPSATIFAISLWNSKKKNKSKMKKIQKKIRDTVLLLIFSIPNNKDFFSSLLASYAPHRLHLRLWRWWNAVIGKKLNYFWTFCWNCICFFVFFFFCTFCSFAFSTTNLALSAFCCAIINKF